MEVRVSAHIINILELKKHKIAMRGIKEQKEAKIKEYEDALTSIANIIISLKNN